MEKQKAFLLTVKKKNLAATVKKKKSHAVHKPSSSPGKKNKLGSNMYEKKKT